MLQETVSSSPFELFDSYTWEKDSQIVTRDRHGVSGLMNFTHFNRLSSSPGSPMHYHTDIIEIHCLLKGRRSTQVALGGGLERWEYTGGEAFVVFPGERHCSGSSAQDPCELYAVQLNLAEADDFLGLNREKGRALCARLAGLTQRHTRVDPETFALLRQAFGLFIGADAAERDAGLMYLLCFLYRFMTLPPATRAEQPAADERIEKVVRYIADNIAEPLPLDGLALLSGYSLSHFKLRFREVTGVTPAMYITLARVERAREELEKGDRSITDIAYRLGWSSSNYFCAVFRKHTGLSPLQYRKQRAAARAEG